MKAEPCWDTGGDAGLFGVEDPAVDEAFAREGMEEWIARGVDPDVAAVAFGFKDEDELTPEQRGDGEGESKSLEGDALEAFDHLHLRSDHPAPPIGDYDPCRAELECL